MRSLLMRSPIAIATAWISAYMLITLSPLLILLLQPAPLGRGFWLGFFRVSFVAAATLFAWIQNHQVDPNSEIGRARNDHKNSLKTGNKQNLCQTKICILLELKKSFDGGLSS